MTKMKVALVHDYLKEYGGAERVLEQFHRLWPEAPIFTLVYLPDFLGPHRQRLSSWSVKPIISAKIPFLAKLISPLRILAPLLFSRLDLSDYDLVMVSATGAYNPNLVKTRKGAHYCYCHTPPRYLYGLPTARNWQKHWWIRFPAKIANHFLKRIDFLSAQKTDYFIANSQNTAARIKKFYRREARVIYPPVDLPVKPGRFKPDAGRYFLAGGRLARAKRIDLAVKACRELDLPLKVFGRAFAGYEKELRQMAGPSVQFLGEITEEQKAELLVNCRAYLFPAEEEDFGIAPVEAMAAGKPVIALRQGGVRETVVENKTGIFFDQPSVDSLKEAIKRFEKIEAGAGFRPEDCLSQASKFSSERFLKEIRQLVTSFSSGKLL